MSTFIDTKQIKDLYESFIEDNEIEVKDKAGDFKEFLKFLEVDLYDWIKENLRCYFREKSQKLVKGQEVKYNEKR